MAARRGSRQRPTSRSREGNAQWKATGLLAGWRVAFGLCGRVPLLAPSRTLSRPCSPLLADNITLGTACGKMFRTSVLTILYDGDSDIIRSIPEAL